MKQIMLKTEMEEIPKSCEECQFHPQKDGIAGKMAFNALCYVDYKDCPLQDVPDREEAREIINNYGDYRVGCEGTESFNEEVTLTKLGYKEGV